ncbi:MAG: hypothetical protein H6662_10400 [Ardenticatenaceae bacterium]|nr:hypothetical protein [Ardenticatenaceae bacterium]MCB8989560.1 hypothetical protein [Ardenticatenaceae bacterium]MCB9003103.1 hypothetical protein [Ardenticatenaceae bacterium]
MKNTHYQRLLWSFLLVLIVGLAACGNNEYYDYYNASGPEDCDPGDEYDPNEEVCYVIDDSSYNDGSYDEEADYSDEEYNDGYYETAEDCYPDEVYDPVDQLCYLADDADTEYGSILDDVFGMFGNEDNQYQDLQEMGEDAIIVYAVNGNEISVLDTPDVQADWQGYQDDTATHQAIWEYFSNLIPADQRDYVSKFYIFTDGVENVYAAVEQDPDDPMKWALAVDIVDAGNQQELTYSLIHEFGHLLTLNDHQVDLDTDLFYQQDDEELYDETAASCPTFFPGEGCSHANSYINQFYQRFWTDLEDEYLDIQAIEDEGEYEDAVYAFYERHPDQFVTDYAATNPGEDIAESWTAFVLQPRPSGSSIADQKVQFFYDYPELVQLREEIVARTFSRLRR